MQHNDSNSVWDAIIHQIKWDQIINFNASSDTWLYSFKMISYIWNNWLKTTETNSETSCVLFPNFLFQRASQMASVACGLSSSDKILSIWGNYSLLRETDILFMLQASEICSPYKQQPNNPAADMNKLFPIKPKSFHHNDSPRNTNLQIKLIKINQIISLALWNCCLVQD